VFTKLAGSQYNKAAVSMHYFRIAQKSMKPCLYWAEKYSKCKDIQVVMGDEGLVSYHASDDEDSDDDDDDEDEDDDDDEDAEEDKSEEDDDDDDRPLMSGDDADDNTPLSSLHKRK
jgi:hypothetical protein